MSWAANAAGIVGAPILGNRAQIEPTPDQSFAFFS